MKRLSLFLFAFSLSAPSLLATTAHAESGVPVDCDRDMDCVDRFGPGMMCIRNRCCGDRLQPCPTDGGMLLPDAGAAEQDGGSAPSVDAGVSSETDAGTTTRRDDGCAAGGRVPSSAVLLVFSALGLAALRRRRA